MSLSSHRPLGIAIAFFLSWLSTAAAAEPEWTVIGAEVLAQVKPGYPGKTAGIAVDRTSGDVYLVVPDQGLWKSTDQAKTFARVDGKAIGGRCETSFAIATDPAGKRLACFMVYGSSGLTNDGGKTFVASKTSHLDFGDVDWSDTGRVMLSLRHESGGVLTLSKDAGATWTDLGKGFQSLGVIDSATLIASKGDGILRSTDNGATWHKVSELQPVGGSSRTIKGATYWASHAGLLVSKDKGATWKAIDAPPHSVTGPYFGKDEKHLIVANAEGLHESLDEGATWKLAAKLPAKYQSRQDKPTSANYANHAYDPINNIFYTSTMGYDALQLKR